MKFVIILLAFLPFNECINLTFIVKKDSDKKTYSCIADEFERYEAIGWVYPIPNNEEEIPKIVTRFVPNVTNDYNCKFSKNNICSKRWSLKDWKIDDSSIKTREFSSDYRWEDLPTILISNTSKEFNERIEIDKVFRSGFSVRASGVIELLVCSGWNPYNHPCYHFNIDNTEIYLNKYAALPKDLNNITATSVEYYKAYSNILSHDEWRNFIISFDEKGIIKLLDVNMNRTIVEHVDEENFSPMYLLVRSSDASLWKFHQNEFLYTNTTQMSRLGPQLILHSKDLCVSLLISLCENCEIIFFYQNGTTRKILKQVGHMQNTPWMEIKLKDENVPSEKLNLFVETKLKDPQSNQTGFWAIDNVRICNENEVKISYLKLNVDSENDDYISCQLIKKPNWRPKKLEYNKINDFPEVTGKSNTTSIKLSWAEEDTRNEINYFVTYQAYDICTTEPYNLRRLKSSGFSTTKYNEIVLYDLVPFTVYNVTISSVLHEMDKQILISTIETMEPTIEELPKNVLLKASNSTVNVSWQEVPCTSVYGKLIYTLIVSNERLNFTKQLSLKTDISYTIDGLQPYTPYSLKIITARNARNIAKGVHISTMVLNFTTLPGAATSVENLEVYSTDDDSVSLRYDLPKDAKGKPTEIQLKRCNEIFVGKCKSYTYPIKRCPLWPTKFCLFVSNLQKRYRYSFRVSLKNYGTDYFGNEVVAVATAEATVPGAPTGVTYKNVDCDIVTDYCHLNISWVHPYNESSTITYFNIILNSTDQHNDVEEEKYIHEVYKVENKSYAPRYTYQIKYLPYGTYYDLYLQSGNALYRSNFTRTIVKTDDLGNHIDQSLKLLEKTDHSLLFKLPPLDPRLDSYVLTVIVQDFDRKKEVDPQLLENDKFTNKLCHKFGHTWISQEVKIENNSTETITIGDSEKDRIKPKTKYCITFIITNKYKETEHDVVYYEKLETPDAPPEEKPKSASSNNHLYMLLLLLLLIPIAFLVYRCLRKKQVIPKPENNENVYETLPFDEYDTNNCVSNNNYDNLIHK